MSIADPYIQSDVDNRSASVIQVESSKLLPVLMLLCMLSGIAVACATFSWAATSKSETETRMLEYYLLELDAKVIAAGIKRPDEAISKKLKENVK